MHDLVRDGSQFVIATHAPMLMAFPGAEVWQFGDDGIAIVEAQATDHWMIMRRFLNDPEAMLGELLRDEEPRDEELRDEES